MHPIWTQTISFGIVMIVSMFLIGLIQKGFFFPFMKVKMSFGKLVLVKVRSVNRDFYHVGKIVDSFLIFNSADGTKRVTVKDNTVFYRCLGTTWVDLEESTNALSKTNYEAVTGFDAQKHDSLYKRCLYRPSITDSKEKFVLALIIVAIIVAAASAYLSYLSLAEAQGVASTVNSIRSGLVIPK